MSVLIKGMKMPTRCIACQLNYDSVACILTGSRFYKCNTEFDPGEERLSDCPLVSVPPHGKLIDADKLVDSFEPSDFWNSDAEDNCFAAVRIVHSAPTIIPADDKDINVLGKEEGE